MSQLVRILLMYTVTIIHYLHVCCYYNCFVQDCIYYLCSVYICCSVIYSSMQLLFVLDIIFLVHHIAFDILYLIIIFDIYHYYLWDLSLYLYNAYYLIFSIIFVLICMWHFLYIDNWLSFSWSTHIDRAYSKILNIDTCAQKLKKLQERFSCTDFEICLQIFCDSFQLFTYNFIIFEKWVISLTLKVIKSHIDDYFWNCSCLSYIIFIIFCQSNSCCLSS